MANETPVAPTAPAPKTPASIAGNISKSIQDRATGIKSGQSNKEQFINEANKPEAPVDANAGKEKYAVDGKEIWLTPEQARAYVQKGIAFEPKVTQLGHLQHEITSFMKELAENPLKILTDKRIGLTPEAVLDKIFASENVSDSAKEKVGNWYYNNVVVPLKMTPEEREAAKKDKKLSEYERREAYAKDLTIKQENQRRVELALSQLKSNVAEAMKDSGLPTMDTPLGAFMSRRVADKMRLAYFQRQTITPKEAIEQVKGELKQVQSSWYDHLDEDSLVKELGEKNAEKVKKYFLKIVKESEKKIPDNPKPRSTERSGDRKTITPDDMAEYLAQLKKENAPTRFK